MRDPGLKIPRAVCLPAQAGVAHELGVMYGIEYWRRRDMGR